jgi:hypothetical protein
LKFMACDGVVALDDLAIDGTCAAGDCLGFEFDALMLLRSIRLSSEEVRLLAAGGWAGVDLRSGMADFGVNGFVADLIGSLLGLAPAALVVIDEDDWLTVAGTFAIASDEATARSQATLHFIRSKSPCGQAA